MHPDNTAFQGIIAWNIRLPLDILSIELNEREREHTRLGATQVCGAKVWFNVPNSAGVVRNVKSGFTLWHGCIGATVPSLSIEIILLNWL